MKSLRRHIAATSVIELLVALAIIGIVLSAAGGLMIQSFGSETSNREQNQAQQSARTAIAAISDELKAALPKYTQVTMNGIKATMPTSTVLGAAAGNATPTSITNYSTPLYFNLMSDDGTTERRIRYWVNGTDLRREIVTFVAGTTTGAASSATAGEVVARNIASFTAQKPFDSASSSDPKLNNYNIVRITITSSLGVNGTPSRFSSVSVSADITLRNNLL